MIVLLKSIQFLLRIIFFLPAGLALSIMNAFAWLTQIITNRTRLKKTVAENIKMLLPQSKIDLLAERLIKNMSQTLFEVLSIPFFRKKHFQRIIKWQGEHHIEHALKEGKGVIILTIHAGNYELIPTALASEGYNINTILRATDDPIFELINKSRSSGGVNLINIIKENMYKESLQVLAKNKLIFLLADTGALESRHEYITFLGKKVPAATGWLTLAQRSECLVIPVLAAKEKRRNIFTFFEPLKVTRETRQEIKQKVTKIFEDYIKKNPEQWGLFLNAYETGRMVKGK